MPIENIPWPNTLGSPAALAATSSVCIGLKSPDAPEYRTRSVRVSVWVRAGATSPSATASYCRRCDMAGSYLTPTSSRPAPPRTPCPHLHPAPPPHHPNFGGSAQHAAPPLQSSGGGGSGPTLR